MKTRIFTVFLLFVFIVSSVNVIGASNQEDENVEIITPVSIMEREPYYEEQEVTVVFSIKNKGESPIYIDSITVAVVNEEEQYSNSQWFRSVVINPNESYHFKGDITFNQSGKYSLFICYKKQNGKWIKFDDPSSILELEISDRNNHKNIEAKDLPKAYEGTQYGPVNIFLNNVHKKFNFDNKELPDGLKLSKDGYISGIPSKSGKFTFEVDFEDGFTETYKIIVEIDRYLLFS